MCIKLRTISNPTHSFTYGLTKTSLSVPCGECYECQQSLKNEWFFRNYAEFKSTTASGGSTFFITLTYADEYLPYLKLVYYGRNKQHDIVPFALDSPCFSLSDIQTFINSLRHLINRDRKKNGFSPVRIRYQVFPEYGSKTKRPHYHCLIYTDKYIQPQKFFRYCDGYDNDFLRRKFYHFHKDKHYFRTREHSGLHQRGAWHKGFVLVSKPEKGGIAVRSEKSILYCAKYSTKDISFYNKPDINHFLASIRDNSIKQPFDVPSIFRIFNQHSARHRQSPSLGFNWMYYKFINDYERIIKDGFQISFDPNKTLSCGYSLPQSYKRKILNNYHYYKDSEGKSIVRWYYNPTSLPIWLAYLRKSISEAANNYSSLIHVNCVNKLTDLQVNTLGFLSHSDLLSYLKSYHFDPRQLAIYKYVFRGRNCTVDFNGEPFSSLCDYSIDYFIDDYEKFYIKAVDNREFVDYGFSWLSLPVSKPDKYYCYDNLPCFKGMNEYLDLLSDLDVYIRMDEIDYKSSLLVFKDHMSEPQLHNTPYTYVI